MTASDIVSWSNPYISQLSPVLLVLAIVSCSDRIVDMVVGIFRSRRE